MKIKERYQRRIRQSQKNNKELPQKQQHRIIGQDSAHHGSIDSRMQGEEQKFIKLIPHHPPRAAKLRRWRGAAGPTTLDALRTAFRLLLIRRSSVASSQSWRTDWPQRKHGSSAASELLRGEAICV